MLFCDVVPAPLQDADHSQDNGGVPHLMQAQQRELQSGESCRVEDLALQPVGNGAKRIKIRPRYRYAARKMPYAMVLAW